MNIGIEKIDLYAGRVCLDVAELAAARKADVAYVTGELMCARRSVYPVYEDAVTLAVNAARRLLSPEDVEQIELLITATESAVDFGKPLSTWVHRFCNLPTRCRNFEIKHACYGGTGALKMAASWVASGLRPGKKALVISADATRPCLGEPAEPLGGGCAVAMLVGSNPQILDIDLERTGYWTEEIADTFRPTARAEVIDDQISAYSYLDALEGAYGHYTEIAGDIDYDTGFQRHIYHAPFPGMARLAHRTLLGGFGITGAAAETSFLEKVAGGLRFAKQIGTCYGASNFVCLLGLLHDGATLTPDRPISLFSYGSGCQGEFYSASVCPGACDRVRALAIARHLEERLPVSVQQYEEFERTRQQVIDARDYEPPRNGSDKAYASRYAGAGLLVLKQVQNYRREYGWS